MRCLLRLLLLWLVWLPIWAEDLVTVDGKTYKGYKVSKVDAEGISIVHESGLARVPFGKLPAELLQKNGWKIPEPKPLPPVEYEWKEPAGSLVPSRARKWKITPKPSKWAAIKYEPRRELELAVLEEGKREKLTHADLVLRWESVPKGGNIIVYLLNADITLANPEHYLFIVTDENGKEISRRAGRDYIPSVHSDGFWVGLDIIPLAEEIRAKLVVRIVDKVGKDFEEFTVSP